MIIDFHTHTYPSSMAMAVLNQLSGSSSVKAYTDGTNEGLIKSCKNNGIIKAVLLPVATNPLQTENINKAAIYTNQCDNELISFGAIHPDNDNYKSIILNLVKEGICGIKLHPVFQKTYFDDIKYMKIIDCACEHGLIISVHSGYDINDPLAKYSTIPHIKRLLDTVKPNKIILAHMGGHLCWDEAEDMLNEYLSTVSNDNVLYLDTAFSLPSYIASQNIAYDFLTNEQFVRIVRLVGSNHILFGTDSPFTDQGPSIEAINKSGLNKKEISSILFENAKDLLNLKS